MNVLRRLSRVGFTGLVAAGLLIGCAHKNTKPAADTADKLTPETSLGSNTAFNLLTTGTVPLTYQWYKGTNIQSSTNAGEKPAPAASFVSNAVFSVAATGTAPLSYQWQFNGTNIQGGTIEPATNK